MCYVVCFFFINFSFGHLIEPRPMPNGRWRAPSGVECYGIRWFLWKVFACLSFPLSYFRLIFFFRIFILVFLKNGFSLFSKLLSALLAHRRIIHRPAHISNKHSRNVLCFYMKYISGMPCNSTKLRLPARLPNFYGKFHTA